MFILNRAGENMNFIVKTHCKICRACKVVFTHKDYNEIKSSYKIDGFENDECVGQLHYVKSNLTGKRYIDQFDYVSFLKNNLIQ